MCCCNDAKLIAASQELVYFETEPHPEYHWKTISRDFRREYGADIFHACTPFLPRDFSRRVFGFREVAPARRLSTPSDFIEGTRLITVTLTARWAIYGGDRPIHAEFNLNLKLIDTSSQEKSVAILPAPGVLTQSRITGRPNVKVFNGSTPYRRAIRWKRERARTGEKGENMEEGARRGGGARNGAGPPFLLFRAVYFSRENSVA